MRKEIQDIRDKVKMLSRKVNFYVIDQSNPDHLELYEQLKQSNTDNTVNVIYVT